MDKSKDQLTPMTYGERIADLLNPVLELEQEIRADLEELTKYDERRAKKIGELADTLLRYIRALAVRIAKREDEIQAVEAGPGPACGDGPAL